jgi:hypothetical protein
MRGFFISGLVVLFLCISTNLYAYRMPEYQISDGDWLRLAEEVSSEYQEKQRNISSRVPVSKLENYDRCHNCSLSPKERKAYKEYNALRTPHQFWKYVVDLKHDLVKMTDGSESVLKEADLLSKKIIQKLYDLSNEYAIVGSALFHNFLINVGAKEKGFCYHYTDTLRKMLAKHHWHHFDFHWGAAWNGTFRENNGLVITGKGRPFESGIVIDPWRSASKPYWHTVQGDRFPWKELHDVQLASE